MCQKIVEKADRRVQFWNQKNSVKNVKILGPRIKSSPMLVFFTGFEQREQQNINNPNFVKYNL